MSHYDRSKDTMLIDLVSKRPILYSSSHPQHRNYIEKHRAWEEISAILDTPIPGLKQRWKHFRDHYHKKKKQTPKKAEWKYMNLLGFLSSKSSTVIRNDSSDFSNVSEFENDGSESASSTGSFTTGGSYKQAEMSKRASKEIKNQTDHKHAETFIERENSPSESQPGEISLGININRNNDKKSVIVTKEPTSNTRNYTQSIAYNVLSAVMERNAKMQEGRAVHKFFEAVAEIVSMLPPHLISEAKLAIHKGMYQIERECLGLEKDDENL